MPRKLKKMDLSSWSPGAAKPFHWKEVAMPERNPQKKVQRSQEGDPKDPPEGGESSSSPPPVGPPSKGDDDLE
jgi:hypothetical protein